MNKRFLAAVLALSILLMGWMAAVAESGDEAEAEAAVPERVIEVPDAAEEDAWESVSGSDAEAEDGAEAREDDAWDDIPDAPQYEYPDETQDAFPDEDQYDFPDGSLDDASNASQEDPGETPGDAPDDTGDPEMIAEEDDFSERPAPTDEDNAGEAEKTDSEIAVKPFNMEEGISPRDCQHPVTVMAVNRDGVDVEYEDLFNGTHRITGSGVWVEVCADCGMVVSRKNAYVEPCAYQSREGHGTVCQWCGHILGDGDGHVHSFSGPYQDFPGELLDTVPDDDDPELYHICRFQKNRARKCDKCEAYEDAQEVPGETIDVREYHVWGSDGCCAVCGYARDCRHGGATYEDEWIEDESCAFINASVHERSAIRYVQRCCARCGEPLGNAEVSRITVLEPHQFRDERCEDCGYLNLCDHRNMRYTYSIDDSAAEYSPVDGLTHRVRGGISIVAEHCPDCGVSRTRIRQPLPEDREIEMPHRFDENGICEECGYAARALERSCQHPEEYRVALDARDVDALKRNCGFEVALELSTETEHVLRVAYDPSWVCALCGHREDLSASGETITVTEPHRFHNGYCVTANCGYKCAHRSVDGDPEPGMPFYENDGASGHRLVMPLLATGKCRLCGEYVKNHIVRKERDSLEHHSMEEGVCIKCGYICQHPAGEIVELLPIERANYQFVDNAGHWVNEERVTETICLACGYTLFEESESLGTRWEAHRWVDGVCADCGCVADAK